MTDESQAADAPADAVAPGSFCGACGAPLTDGHLFCEACGAEVPGAAAAVEGDDGAAPTPTPVGAPAEDIATCTGCGATTPLAEGWCSTCGMKLPAPRDHEELELAGAAGVCDKGVRHHRNEDAMAASVGDGAVFALVCDGVSTTVRPDDASRASCDAALAVLERTELEPAERLHAAYDAAREAVLAIDFTPQPDLGPPSCTFLAAVITDAAVYLAALGDCRAYWCDAEGVRQLTEDDSWATEQVRSGALEPSVAYADQRAHAITHWIARDADPGWRPTLGEFIPPGPGRLLLCSDGLWNYTVEPAVLARELAAAGTTSLLDTARFLVRFANDAGGADNITAVLVDLPLVAATPKGPDPAP